MCGTRNALLLFIMIGMTEGVSKWRDERICELRLNVHGAYELFMMLSSLQCDEV